MRATKRKMVLEDEGTVLDKARERMDTVWEEYDQQWLSFSGGKDSGACLSMALEAWDRNGPFRDDNGNEEPINIIHFDDEFAYPETDEYIERVIENYEDRVHFWWFAIPIKYGLAVTGMEEYDTHYWYPWNPNREDDWLRPHPREREITNRDNVTVVTPDHELLSGFAEGWKHKHVASHFISQKATENTIQLVGVRTAESLRRHTAVLGHGGWLYSASDRFSSGSNQVFGEDSTDFQIGYPIYDWKDTDLWKIHDDLGWDYNKTYDTLHHLGYALRDMRTAHPFHYMSVRAGAGDRQKPGWAEEFENWVMRHKGMDTAFDYGIEAVGPMCPEDKTWEEYAALLLNNVPDEERKQELVTLVQNRLNKHHDNTQSSLPQAGICDLCGQSWRQIAETIYEDVYGVRTGQA